jgi:hypothetical protein
MSLSALLDKLRWCRKELMEERRELLMLHDEHRALSERVIRKAAETRDAMVGVTIILTVEEIDHLFARADDDERRRAEHQRKTASR